MPDTPFAPGNGQGEPQHQEAPAGGGDKGFDFEQGYNQLRPEYTRTTQELAALRDHLSGYEGLFAALHDPDPTVQQEAMQALGLEPVQDGPSTTSNDEFVDPLEQEVEALRAWREEQEARQAAEMESAETQQLMELRDEYIDEEIDTINEYRKTNGLPSLTDDEQEVLGNLAIARESEGIPDVRDAYQRLYGSNGVLEIERQRWIETKTGAPQAPPISTLPVDQRPKTAAERIAYIDERAQRMAEQQ